MGFFAGVQSKVRAAGTMRLLVCRSWPGGVPNGIDPGSSQGAAVLNLLVLLA